MKKIITVIAITLTSCGGNENKEQQETQKKDAAKVAITIKGSDTVLPLSQKQAEAFMVEHADASITVVGGGSGVGITALLDGSTDIAMSSRPLKMDEKMEFQKKNMNIKEVIIASDALAVVVNPKNKVGQLTREQLEGIFTGEITNWKKVGGTDMRIVAYARETSSGTYEFFKEHVMDKKNYASSVLNMPATSAIVESVAKTEGAVGYIGIAYETKEIKHVAVSYDEGKTFVLPSIQSSQDGTYPVSRPLYYYYDAAKEETVKTFVDYLLSPKGQQNVADVGYVPLVK